MLEIPTLETEHLVIRPFAMDDLEDVHQLFDVELNAETLGTEHYDSLGERAEWLQWVVLNYTQLAKLNQPPYGDRAIVLKEIKALIGSCGFVPCLNAFEQLPYFSPSATPTNPGRYSPEVGLFYAISPRYQRQGYASEAAQALVDYAFKNLNIKRIVATTDYENVGSMGVMSKLGMHIKKNPQPEPPWLQVVGVLENTTST